MEIKIIYKNVNELKAYENNPRDNDKAVEAVAASIREFGFKVPLVITEDNVIVTGHTRLKAAKYLGLDSVPCIVASDLNEEQIRAFRLADNKTSELSSWDFELLEEELANLDLDMTQFGFEKLLEEIPEEEIKDDDFNEDDVITDNPYSQKGDIFLLGKHRLICGDSTSEEVVNKLVEDTAIDLILTDPPYNCDYEGSDGQKIENDKMSDEDFRDFILKAFKNMFAHCKDGANAFVFHRDIEGVNFQGGFKNAGFKLAQMWIWVKNSATFGRGWAHYQHEPIMVGWKEGAPHYVTGDRTLTTVLEYDKPKHNDLHPTMKPIELMAFLIKEGSRLGEKVLDLFGGSGTTLIASEQTGRIAFLSEITPKYTDVIVKRFLRYQGSYDGCFLIRGGEQIPLSDIPDYHIDILQE